MSSLRVGLVGFGWFGRKHYRAWTAVNGVEVVAVADPRIDEILSKNGSVAQSGFHAGDDDIVDLRLPRCYRSIEEMLDNERLDLVDIVVDENDHYLAAKTALISGIPVLVEKPFTTSYQHAMELGEIAASRGISLFVGNILRFDLRVQMIKDKVARGELGDIQYLSFKRNFQPSAHAIYGRTNPFFSALVHDIDLSLLFSGRQVTRVVAEVRHLFRKESPDVLLGMLCFGDDLLCTLENVWHVSPGCPSGFENEFALYGSRATVVHRNTGSIEIWGEQRAEAPDLFFWPSIGGCIEGALLRMLRHYATCTLKSCASDILPLADAIEGIRIAEALVLESKKNLGN